jgi:hypothetical protein
MTIRSHSFDFLEIIPCDQRTQCHVLDNSQQVRYSSILVQFTTIRVSKNYLSLFVSNLNRNEKFIQHKISYQLCFETAIILKNVPNNRVTVVVPRKGYLGFLFDG